MEMNEFTPLTVGEPQAEAVTVPEADLSPLPEAEMVENPDGSVTFLEEEAEEKEPDEFDSNLADGYLPREVLDQLGTRLTELVEADRENRTERDKKYAEGIKRTGLGDEAPGGADFRGASRAVHPMLIKGCVDFASKAVKELFPAQGPCKTQIIGEATESKLDRAERKRAFMNWQLTTQVPENRSELEKLLSQVGLGGSQYKRWWWDARLKRPRTETVYIDDVFMPYHATSFDECPRITHRQWVSESEFNARVDSGLYIDAHDPGGTSFNEKSESEKAAAKVEGATDDAMAVNEQGNREIYMTYADLEIEEDRVTQGESAPYIVHIARESGKILGVYRNWAEEDETRAKKAWMVDYTFIPWRGAQGIGLIHIIGSLSAAATGSLRAILDAALIQNFPGAMKLKAGRTAGQSISPSPTEITEVDAPPGVDDIRKLMMAFPFNGPSAVLYNVLEFLTQQAEVVVATASEKIADGAKDMPVGTALALIEHGSTNFSAIHARMHASLKKELAIVHRLNAENLSDKEVVAELGELTVSREDFQGPMDIIPVSDPNIFTETQRYAQLQACMQLYSDPRFANFFKPDRMLQRALQMLKIPAPEDVANLPKDPEFTPALEENYVVASSEPRPLKVYEVQDDLAHLIVHTTFMTSPIFGGSPLLGMQILPPLLEHCKEHIVALYRKHTQGAAEAMLEVAKMQGLPLEPEEAQVQGAAFADRMLAQLLAPQILPALDAAQKQAMQMAPKPPPSPDVAHAEANKMAIAQANNNNALALKDKELAYQHQRDEADRLVTRQAGQLAAAVEELKVETSKQLAHFNAFVGSMKQEMQQDMQLALAELNASAAQQLEALKAALVQQPTPQVDLQPLLDAMMKLTEDVSTRIDTVEGSVRDNHAAVQGAFQDAVNRITEQSNNTLLGLVRGAFSSKSKQPPAEE